MKTYTVTDVATMLNLHEETVRRWVREGKINAIRNKGRGGHSMTMTDIIAYVNTPPRTYLPALESWLDANGFEYEKIWQTTIDRKESCNTILESGAIGAGTAIGMSAAGIASALAGPIGMIAGATYAATKAVTKKNYPSHTIQLLSLGADDVQQASDDVNFLEDGQKGTEILQEDPLAYGEPETTLPHIDVQLLPQTTATDQKLPDSELVEQPSIVENSDWTADQNDTEELIGSPEYCATVDKSDAPVSIASVFDEIARAKQLYDADIITQEEFVAIKARLIAKI